MSKEAERSNLQDNISESMFEDANHTENKYLETDANV